MGKTYLLSVWHDDMDGRMRFGVTMQDEIVYDFRIRLRLLADSWQGRSDELERLVALSREYQRFGDFLLGCERRSEALRQYLSAAQVCLLLREGDKGRSGVCRRLRERFFEMYALCWGVADGEPKLEEMLHAAGIEDDARSIG